MLAPEWLEVIEYLRLGLCAARQFGENVHCENGESPYFIAPQNYHRLPPCGAGRKNAITLSFEMDVNEGLDDEDHTMQALGLFHNMRDDEMADIYFKMDPIVSKLYVM